MLALVGGGVPGFGQDPHRFDTNILEFERQDRVNPPAPGSVLFVGSSSIRLWVDLAKDFAGHRVLNRGFGGSHISDVNFHFGRVVLPYRPGLIVLYAGDNDIAGGKSPETVRNDFREFVRLVRTQLGDVRIGFIAIKPSPSRWSLIDAQRRANRLVREACVSGRGLTFLEIGRPMLGPDGRPRDELFVADRLHLSRAGYDVWRDVVRGFVDRYDRGGR